MHLWNIQAQSRRPEECCAACGWIRIFFWASAGNASGLIVSLRLSTEFIIQYEESQWEPGNWKELLRVPGNHASSVLKLHGHVDYRFRVAGVNSVGRGPPSEPTERYKTPPTGPMRPPCVVESTLYFWIKEPVKLPTFKHIIDSTPVENRLLCVPTLYFT